ncbi:hypothetical protein ASG94_18645 [Nocardioides sp. Soil805]|nr:hypothetical protein ASG94_18645 [Nocardioides sp. Soil805]
MRGMNQQHTDEPGTDGTDGTTGVAEVDAVLASLDGLADLPVAEHVAVFEQAHERLRRALDAPSG